MTGKRFFLFFVIFLLFSNYPIVGETVEREFGKIIEFRENGNIYLKNINGNVEAKSWDRNDVEVKAVIKVKAGNIDDARDFLDEVKILIDASFDNIAIEVDYPRRKGGGFWDLLFGWGKPKVSISFWLMVPKISNLDMNTTNGKIKIYDIEGKVFSKSTNGTISVEKVNGDAELRTTNGSISADYVTGDIKANTTNGKINMKGIVGNIDAKTTNGGISAVIVSVVKEKEMNFKTTNGSVAISLSKDINAYLDARTTNGKIYTEFPILFQGEIKKNHITGKINNGGPLIYIKTTNGGIKILESNVREQM